MNSITNEHEIILKRSTRVKPQYLRVERQWANPLEKYDPKEFDYAAEDAILAELEQTN